MFRIIALCSLYLLSLSALAEVLPADPTKPAASTQTTSKPVADINVYKLASVLVGKRRTAIINGQVVEVGNSINGAKVLEITRQGVGLETKKGYKFLYLSEHNGFKKVKIKE